MQYVRHASQEFLDFIGKENHNFQTCKIGVLVNKFMLLRRIHVFARFFGYFASQFLSLRVPVYLAIHFFLSEGILQHT